jgi:acylphosphatase
MMSNDERQPGVMQIHIHVSGKVQGVFYRKHTQITAAKLGLCGWVRNLDDGRVEILAQGPEEALIALEMWSHKGSPNAMVKNVETEWRTSVDTTLRSFQVQR